MSQVQNGVVCLTDVNGHPVCRFGVGTSAVCGEQLQRFLSLVFYLQFPSIELKSSIRT
jgi:hypothetical protein